MKTMTSTNLALVAYLATTPLIIKRHRHAKMANQDSNGNAPDKFKEKSDDANLPTTVDK